MATFLCFLGGMGDGINRAQRYRILMKCGFMRDQIALLDRDPSHLSGDERDLVDRQKWALGEYIGVRPESRQGKPPQ